MMEQLFELLEGTGWLPALIALGSITAFLLRFYFQNKQAKKFNIPLHVTYRNAHDYFSSIVVIFMYIGLGVVIPALVLAFDMFGTPLTSNSLDVETNSWLCTICYKTVCLKCNSPDVETNRAGIGIVPIILCVVFSLVKLNLDLSFNKKAASSKGHLYRVIIFIIRITTFVTSAIFFTAILVIAVNHYEPLPEYEFYLLISRLWKIAVLPWVLYFMAFLYVHLLWHSPKSKNAWQEKKRGILILRTIIPLLTICLIFFLRPIYESIYSPSASNTSNHIVVTIMFYVTFIFAFMSLALDKTLFGNVSSLSTYAKYTIAKKENNHYIVWMKHTNNEWILIPCKIEDDQIDYNAGEFIISKLSDYLLNVGEYKRPNGSPIRN